MQANTHSLQLMHLQIKSFRCFSQITLDLDGAIVLIEGNNGSGKTSILEALHYLCYLRSFRTHSPRELVQFDHESFFIKATFKQLQNSDEHMHDVQVGFSGKKRLVKINQQSVSSYKELLDHYRIVTLTEDDLALINEGPEIRRAFIDQAILLLDPEFITTIRTYKQVVDNRMAVLLAGGRDHDSYIVWTQQLWQRSRIIQDRRKEIIFSIEQEVNSMIKNHFNDEFGISLTYQPKKMGSLTTLQEFLEANGNLKQEEVRFGRSLFGAHLDDIAITFQDKRSKTYASRGQQKLIVLLVKIALIRLLGAKKGPVIFLLDDFMTDFDQGRAQVLLDILVGLNSQLIFTSPLKTGFFEEKLLGLGAFHIKLTH
ncbi:MAG: DNA replication and repair protein RecF [Candidatus Dependentiae bacterium]|nr:DNA replication and repair protein RecF [Candidatus Dependentiae bacterium]